VASGLVAKTLAIVRIGAGNDERSLQALLYGTLFRPLANPWNGSLAYATANVVFWYLCLLWLDRRGIHVSI
jgi:predicted acyltransferase